MFEADVAAVAGPKGRHDPDRVALRHGQGRGSVTLGGRRVPVVRPRVRAADGSGELAVPAYEHFAGTEVLGRMAMERMLAGLSTRRYPVWLEPVGRRTETRARATSKSAVSRKFIAATETALAELLARPLGGLDLVALMVDGVHFGEHVCVVALGIDVDGTKHPLALVEGSTENTSTVRGLLVGSRERGRTPPARPWWSSTGPRPSPARCGRSSTPRWSNAANSTRSATCGTGCPNGYADQWNAGMRAAYHSESALDGEAQLRASAGELDKTHPGAAGSLREGMAETLTVLRLHVPPTLACTMRSTKPVESMISICREHASNVKHWQDGRMALRWCAAGMLEAGKQFRRVNGHLHLPALRNALDRHVADQTASGTRHTETVNAA